MADDEYARYSRDVRNTDEPRRAKTNVWGIVCVSVLILATIVSAIVAIAVFSHTSAEPTPAPPAAPSSVAAEAIQPIVVLEFACNHRFANGTCQSYFSYTNSGAEPLIVERGLDNSAAPGVADRGQRTRFDVGTHFGADAIVWNCASHSRLDRTLRTGGVTSVASAPRDDVACPSLRSLA